jgi:ssDNA-binding Zn-finger/Zn-ribbon topoisomerase 1
MATLTIDLPDVPRPQAAYRLAADCPRCGASLVLRQNRQTGALFTGCSAYPSCAFSEPHDPRVQTLSTGVVRAVQALATQVAQIQAEAQRQAAAERVTLERTVRQLIALAHPDSQSPWSRSARGCVRAPTWRRPRRALPRRRSRPVQSHAAPAL